MAEVTQDIRTTRPTPPRRGIVGWLVIIVVIAAIIAGAWMYFDKKGGTVTEGLPRNAVATVNGYEVSETEFNSRLEQARANLEIQGVNLNQEGLAAELRKQVANDIVNERLLLQDAEKKGITVDDATLDQTLSSIKSRFETEAAFKTELEKGKFTDEAWKESVRRQLIIQKYIDEAVKGQNVTATDVEIAAFYEQVKAQQPEGQKVPTLAEVKTEIAAQISQQKIGQIVQQIIAALKTEGTVVLSEDLK